jgi:hypothetical protein
MTDTKTHPLYSRDCKLCGAPLAIMQTGENKMIALDLCAKIYAPTEKAGCVRTTLSLVDHMEVCKKL